MGECKFSMKVLYSSEFTLDNGVTYQFYLESQEGRVFKFPIPDTSEDSTDLSQSV